MKTEKEKMLAGEMYNARDSQLKAERRRARLLIKNYNESTDEEGLLRKEILRELIGGYSRGLSIEPPFYCDYGGNISVGENVYFNFNCVAEGVAGWYCFYRNYHTLLFSNLGSAFYNNALDNFQSSLYVHRILHQSV